MSNEFQIIEDFDIDHIQLDERYQHRAKISPKIVDQYATDLKSGHVFPPPEVYQLEENDNIRFQLVDGFQRISAYKQNGSQNITIKLYQGSEHDAFVHSISANADHGVRRIPADKRQAIEDMLLDETCQKWSDYEIAKCLNVHVQTVRKQHKKLIKQNKLAAVTEITFHRDGKTHTMNTDNIGMKQSSQEANTAIQTTDEPQEEQPLRPHTVEEEEISIFSPVVKAVDNHPHIDTTEQGQLQYLNGHTDISNNVNGADNSEEEEKYPGYNKISEVDSLLKAIINTTNELIQDYKNRHPEPHIVYNRIMGEFNFHFKNTYKQTYTVLQNVKKMLDEENKEKHIRQFKSSSNA